VSEVEFAALVTLERSPFNQFKINSYAETPSSHLLLFAPPKDHFRFDLRSSLAA
jgi:hypothetical protein